MMKIFSFFCQIILCSYAMTGNLVYFFLCQFFFVSEYNNSNREVQRKDQFFKRILRVLFPFFCCIVVHDFYCFI